MGILRGDEMSESDVVLARVPAGERVKIESLAGGPTFVSRMAALGLRPGVLVEVLQNRGAVVVRAHETRVVLGRGEAEKIHVSRQGSIALELTEESRPITEPKRYVVALAGQPNVGKSTIFNLLTGLNQHVGNWPGKTVEQKVGHHRFREDVLLEIIDLPGTYSLTANSLEERIARDYIIQEHPDVVIVVADATHLERGLYLLAEVLALPVKAVFAINMMDLAEEEGIRIEPHVLEAALGIPVIPMAANRNEGVRELVDMVVAVAEGSRSVNPVRPELAGPIQALKEDIEAQLNNYVPRPYPVDWVVLKLLEGDQEITEKVKSWVPAECWRSLSERLHHHEDSILAVVSSRYEWVARLLRAAVHEIRRGRISLTDRLDKIAIHPVWGWLVLVAVLGSVFFLTYTVALPLQEWLESSLVIPAQTWVKQTLSGRAPEWLVDLVSDGVLGGAGTVLTFLPILAVFFTFMAVLEDSGYLARAAYMVDRCMHWMGLHGKSFLPLFLGFGCNVPAVMGTRILESPLNRLLTILLIPLVPCSARLGVLAFLTPIFFGRWAGVVATGLVVFNLLLLVLLGVLFHRFLFQGRQEAFIMEIPLYHWPNWKTVMLDVWHHCLAFLRRAGGIILIMAVLIWVLSSFPGPGIDHSWLAAAGRMLAPVGEWMGMDWRLLMALLTGFVAKENVVATLGVLYSGEGAGLRALLLQAVSPATALAFLVVMMVYLPCLATTVTIYQETRSLRWTLFDIAVTLLLAILLGVAIYHGASWLASNA